MRRKFIAVVMAAFAACIIFGVSSASATPFPGIGGADDPLNYAGCWASGCTPLNVGGFVKGGDGGSIGGFFTNPDAYTGSTANTATIGTEVGEVQVATNLLPKLKTVAALRNISMGVGAFSTGWAIGSILNEKFLHIAGVGLGNTTTVPSATTAISWRYFSPTGYPTATTNQSPFFNSAILSPAPTIRLPAGLYLSGTNSGCSTTAAVMQIWTGGVVPPTCWENASQAAVTAMGSAAVQINAGACVTSGGNTSTCNLVYIPEADMPKAIITDQQLQPYNGQPVTITTPWPTPGGQGDVTDALTTIPTTGDPIFCANQQSTRGCLPLGSTGLTAGISALDTSTGAGISGMGIGTSSSTDNLAFLNELRCIAYPEGFNCPTWSGGSISTVGGAKFVMPDVTGMSHADAVAAINALYTKYTWTPPAITTVTLPDSGAVITKPAGAVVTTSPGALVTQATPATTVVLTENPDPLPLIILQPLPWETGVDYAARMAQLGIKVSLIPTGTAVSGYGPDEVILPADVPVGSTTWTYLPGARVPGTATPTVTVPVNISTATVPAGDPNTGTGTGTGSSSCNCPALDFSPLGGIGLGSKFPFGLFTYAAGIIGDFNVTAQAPDFNLRAQATGVHGNNLDAAYDVNLGDMGANRVGSQLDTYMGWWRDLLSFAMWVGALWWVGTKLLGFDGTGDPGGGVDEVL